jgi:hypothetical protein
LTNFVGRQLDTAMERAVSGMRSDVAHRLYATRVYGAFSRFSMPVAHFSLRVASGLADGAQRLSERISDIPLHAKEKPVTTGARRRAGKPAVARKTVAAKARRRVAK